MTEIEQYSNGVRWESGMDEDFDPGSNSSKLFERSRIKALAGTVHYIEYEYKSIKKCWINVWKFNKSFAVQYCLMNISDKF